MGGITLIHLIEAYPAYDALVTEVFQRIGNGTLTGYTSAISLTEVLALPMRLGNASLQQEYRDLLLHSNHFSTVWIDFGIAESAAELRARYNLRTPDALQIAAALSVGCEAFLTNDVTLKRVTDLRILVLDGLEG